MSGWRLHGVRAVVGAAVIAGGYLCTIGAHDHARPPEGPAAQARVDVLAAAEPSATTCAREAGGITCTEEIVVVAPRRAHPPIVVSQREERPQPDPVRR